jgi:hypothetical protein
MLRVFIGYDSREPITYAVCAHSVLRRASQPVMIVPLALPSLARVYGRPPNGTTEFSLTRFLAPYLSNFSGMSVFMDSDMVCLTDIHEVLASCSSAELAVWCCQHDYQPREGLKATGVQTAYPRKNWSSFMVFNNRRCRELSPEYVNTASPADLHRMAWADGHIGALPFEWNWLVGEYEPNPNAKVLHYTLGAPCFPAYRESDHAAEWFAELSHMSTPMTIPKQMVRLEVV